MTALLTAPAVRTAPEIAPIGPGLRLRTELRRLANTRASQLLLLGVGLFSVAVVGFYATTLAAPGASTYEYMVVGGQFFALAMQIIAVLAISAEWRQRTALSTYALDPNRTGVLLAKVGALWLLGMAFTVIAAVLGAVVGAIAGAEFGGLAGIASAFGWLTVHVTVSVLVGAALGAAFQSVAAPLVIVLMGPQMIPSLVATVNADLARWADYLTPLNEAITARAFTGEALPFAVSLLLWIALPLGIGIYRNARRDVG